MGARTKRKAADAGRAPIPTAPSPEEHRATGTLEAVLEARRDIRKLALRLYGTTGTLPDVDDLTADAVRSGFDSEPSETAATVARAAAAALRVSRDDIQHGERVGAECSAGQQLATEIKLRKRARHREIAMEWLKPNPALELDEVARQVTQRCRKEDKHATCTPKRVLGHLKGIKRGRLAS